MGVGAGLYMYVVVVQKFTFAISSPDEFLFWKETTYDYIITAKLVNSVGDCEFGRRAKKSQIAYHFLQSLACLLFSERELSFTFAICCRPSVCLSSVSVCL